MISLLPSHYGFGFTADEPLAADRAKGYRYEQVGRYHNYHFTSQEWELPFALAEIQPCVIDGFSPNLNKRLHIGHLRNLAVGSSVSKIVKAKAVAMLGACLGQDPESMEELQWWYKLASYSPEIYIDIHLIPSGYDYAEFSDGVGEQVGCKVTKGENPIIVRKSSGQAAYAMHDLMFAAKVKPTHYVTADEQSSHFKSIGLGDKHLAMGLVLGEDGKKMKSRDGGAFLSQDALAMVFASLEPNSPHELAWNVLAWNFLSVKRTQNVKFIPKLWANPDRGGLYISYTYARVLSALKNAGVSDEPGPFDPLPKWDEEDVPLLGMSSYYTYYMQRARQEMDPCPLANYTFELAKQMGSLMEKRRVIGGTASFKTSLWMAKQTLGHCMSLLTMYPLTKV